MLAAQFNVWVSQLPRPLPRLSENHCSCDELRGIAVGSLPAQLLASPSSAVRQYGSGSAPAGPAGSAATTRATSSRAAAAAACQAAGSCTPASSHPPPPPPTTTLTLRSPPHNSFPTTPSATPCHPHWCFSTPHLTWADSSSGEPAGSNGSG